MPLSRMLVFFLVVFGITAGLHYYVWARLVRDTALPMPWRALATWAIALLAALVPFGFLIARLAPRPIASPVMWTVYTWLGLWFFAIVLLVPGDAFRGVLAIVSGTSGVDESRRLFMTRALGSFAGVGAVALGAIGTMNALAPVRLQRVRVALSKFPAALDGYSILQLTDIHVGPTIGREFIEQLVTRALAEDPDMVVITGDLVDGSVDELAPLVEPLRRLRARDGVYFVTGNHEYYSGADEWIAHLGSMNIRVLRNEHVSIRGAEGFDLAGVDDHSAASFGNGHGMDPERAVAGRNTDRALVMLAHQPNQIEATEPHGVDLQLSGHTHGGQIFPFNFLVRLQQRYIAGLYRHGRAALYVSRGTGYWGPPMRLGAPAEITRIELSRAAS